MFKLGDQIIVTGDAHSEMLRQNGWPTPHIGYKGKIVGIQQIRDSDNWQRWIEGEYFLQVYYTEGIRDYETDSYKTWIHSSDVRRQPRFTRNLPEWF